jgi:hypothetical protein
MMMSVPFPYACDVCEAALCERLPLFSLANGLEEDTLCVACLSARLGVEPAVLVPKTKRYIQRRDCFRKPWNAITADACPRIATGECPCQDE